MFKTKVMKIWNSNNCEKNFKNTKLYSIEKGRAEWFIKATKFNFNTLHAKK